MPTSGKADYAGTFEGLEQSAPTGAPVQTSNISGTANLSATSPQMTCAGASTT